VSGSLAGEPTLAARCRLVAAPLSIPPPYEAPQASLGSPVLFREPRRRRPRGAAGQAAGNTRAHRFFADWEREVVRLERELREGSYRPGAYFYFTITEPKERVVAAAPFRDRVLARLPASLFPSASSVVHHALVRVIEPRFEPRWIEDSYACRKGKGTHAGMRRALEFAQPFPWAMKCDIRRYFPSIDQGLLRARVVRVIGDPQVLGLRVVRHGGEKRETLNGCERPARRFRRCDPAFQCYSLVVGVVRVVSCSREPASQEMERK